MRWGRRKTQSGTKKCQRPFLVIPGPLKGLKVANPRIPTFGPQLLLFPDTDDKPPSLLLTSSCFLPPPLSHFGLRSQTRGLYFPCMTAGQKTSAWLTDLAWPVYILPCSPRTTSLLSRCSATAFIETLKLHHLEFCSSLFTGFHHHCLPAYSPCCCHSDPQIRRPPAP